METEPQIVFRGVESTPELNRVIAQKIAKLEKVYDRITTCRVLVERPQQKGQKGHLHRVMIEVGLPTGSVAVGRNPGDINAHEDVKVALRDSFAAARRQLIEHHRKVDGLHVKSHPEKQQGRVTDVIPGEGFGYMETPAGEQVYFQRSSMTSGDWDKVSVGAQLRFRRMEGEKGPYAVNITLVDEA